MNSRIGRSRAAAAAIRRTSIVDRRDELESGLPQRRLISWGVFETSNIPGPSNRTAYALEKIAAGREFGNGNDLPRRGEDGQRCFAQGNSRFHSTVRGGPFIGPTPPAPQSRTRQQGQAAAALQQPVGGSRLHDSQVYNRRLCKSINPGRAKPSFLVSQTKTRQAPYFIRINAMEWRNMTKYTQLHLF
jgi:hypothetical protein